MSSFGSNFDDLGITVGYVCAPNS